MTPQLAPDSERLVLMRALYLDWKEGWKGIKRLEFVQLGCPDHQIRLLIEAGLVRRHGEKLFITADGVAWAETFDKEICHA